MPQSSVPNWPARSEANIKSGKAAPKPPFAGERLIPNPKARLKDQLHEVARYRQLSLRTETTYWQWIRRYILFHHKRHPREMGGLEVRTFLSHLATQRQVAAATQHQALNALAFLYREVLFQELGEIGAFDRPKRPPHLPVVMSRKSPRPFHSEIGIRHSEILLPGAAITRFQRLNHWPVYLGLAA